MKTILSIDGGGIRGLLPALVLAQIEARLNCPIAKCFDLIAGTSTGGILALGLAKDDGQGVPQYSAQALVDMYEQHGKEIFPRSLWRGVSSVGGLLDEAYPHKGLELILKQYFNDEPLGASLTRLLLTTYDIHNRKPLFLKSWRLEHHTVLMRHAARATSAAPTYFEPAHIPVDGAKRALVDGGVFINSPSVSAYAEAQRIYPEESEFMLVSLGTGELNRPIELHDAKDWGKAGWVAPLLSCIFDGVADAADYQMDKLLGDNYYRLQTTLDIASDDMDDVTNGNIANLKSEGNKLLEASTAELDALCQRLADKN
ncbi:patatin-like phospholipase family protein [Pseudoalteromonas sp. YIC-827]|uniref:Patatin-like phospholipase family protein n=1 Tax=Pseudoalteromonas qingdaonensis TaxID=3131913 RepID=A0ABU9MX58_9GAMM